MPVRSPYPDVEIPEVSLFDFLFTDFGDRADAVGVHRRQQRRRDDLRRAEGDGAADRRGAGRARRRRPATWWGSSRRTRRTGPRCSTAVLRANAIVTSVNSLYTAGELAHQLVDSGAEAAVHGLAVPGPGHRRDARGRPLRERDRRAGRRGGLHLAARPAGHDGRAAGAHRRPGRHRRAAVLLGHHRPGQGRDPHPPQPGGQPVPGRPVFQLDADRSDPGRAAVLPHLRHDRDDEQRPVPAGHRGHDAEVRPGRVPAGHLRPTGSTSSTSPRRSRSRWPSTRSSRTTTCPAWRTCCPVRPRWTPSSGTRWPSGWRARCARATG